MTKLSYKKYKDRLKEIFPLLSEKERKEIFYFRVKYWNIIIDNYKVIK